MKSHVFDILICLGFIGVTCLQAIDPAFGENPLRGTKDCIGSLYRPKRDGVPVYNEPDTTAEVLATLKIGDRVCYIGETKGFAILVWEKSSSQASKAGRDNNSAVGESEDNANAGYSRLVELWPPRNASTKRHPDGILGRVKQYYYNLQQGGVPDVAPIPQDLQETSPQQKTP